MKNENLLSEAILKINTASETLIKYYSILEERIKILTEEVDQKKRLLSSIIDSIDIAVVFFDRDGVIRLINRAAELLFNVKTEEVTGQNNLPIKIENDLIYPAKSAKPFYAILSQSDVLDSEGEKIGHVFLCKDITRVKELEAENERNRRLTAMGSLIMKIAHEIRNPLGSIELFANMISEDIKESIHGDYARRISSSVRMLRNTLENMLSFTRGMTVKKTPVCINKLVEEITEEFKELFSSAAIATEIKMNDKLVVPLDFSLIRQALINLIVNAYQAMPEGGRITINSSICDNCVKLTIKDTGHGIDEEIIERIFDPFFSTKDRGTGLGLSITNSIISAHGGRIEVKSKTGEGTEFAVYLPLE
ncbi:MAG TPA: ATP-binding protein [Thermodesulfovibrio thiophilus]|nr:ATP-binding protein [Thermodesulfovibrio thiophilus]HQA03250.1 ATP-binding protein [Thermodesulfovibrio thiophilus]HQD36174.1 ATP-binding protein [Thermodesulfovibrio thiophilus]